MLANRLRFRHKKCDETKPACTQCIKTGRTCDFLNPSLSSPAPKPPKSKPKALIPSRSQGTRSLPTIIPAPTFGFPFQSHEIPHFDYFRHLLIVSTSSHSFSSSISSSFHKLVLQLSHEEMCIRDAVMAISALLRYQSRRHHPVIDVKRYQINAYIIYRKAIIEVNKRISC